MTMLKMLVSTACAAVIALPAMASAATYDFADFGNSVFSYGYGTAGTSFTAFGSSYAGGCFGVADFACKTAGGNSDLPMIGVNTGSSSFHFQTVDVPTDTLFFHPGSAASGSDALLIFTAPTDGTYTINNAGFERLDETPTGGNGVVLSAYVNNNFASSATLANGPQYSSIPLSGSVALLKGDQILLAVNNNGDYSYDSTGLFGSISSNGAVPEPATWAMMLLGFGMVGAGLRYRRKSTTARFA